MIREYASDLAAQLGITLSSVTIVEGRRIGCSDSHLLHLTAVGQKVSALIHQSELDELYNGYYCGRLELKIHSALSRLKLMLQS